MKLNKSKLCCDWCGTYICSDHEAVNYDINEKVKEEGYLEKKSPEIILKDPEGKKINYGICESCFKEVYDLADKIKTICDIAEKMNPNTAGNYKV